MYKTIEKNLLGDDGKEVGQFLLKGNCRCKCPERN